MLKIITKSFLLILLLLASVNMYGVTVNSDGTANYPTLSAAIEDVRNGTLTGDVIITLQSDITEPSSNGIGITASGAANGAGAGTANYNSITINTTGANFTVTGSVNRDYLGDFYGALLELWGADSVSVQNITFVNTSTSQRTAGALLMFGGANNNSFTNCGFQENFTDGANAISHGAVNLGIYSVLGVSSASNNTFTNCVIGGETDPCLYAVYSSSPNGTSSSNRFVNCEFYDYFDNNTDHGGIFLGTGNTQWTISNNKFYQTATREITANNIEHTGIRIENGTGYTITNNTIGYTSNANTGTYTINAGAGDESQFMGIWLSGLSSTGISTISGNTITSISFQSSSANQLDNGNFEGVMCGIMVGSQGNGTSNGNVTISNNLIGNTTSTANILYTSESGNAGEFVGIYTSVNGTVGISGNSISGISTQGSVAADAGLFTGIRAYGAGASITISNCLVGSTTTANSIMAGSSGVTTGSSYADGIATINTGTSTISNCTVANMSSFGTGSDDADDILQVCISADLGTVNISSNSVYAIDNASDEGFTSIQVGSATPTLVGVYVDATGTVTVEQNTVHDLDMINTGAVNVSVVGIFATDGGAGSSISRNKVYDLLNASSSSSAAIEGITHSFGGSYSIHNNMIALTSSAAQDIAIDGIFVAGAATTDIFNNSIYVYGTSGGSVFSSCLLVDNNAGGEVKNNIFWNDRSGSESYCLVSTGTDSDSCDYNLYFASSVADGLVAVRGAVNQATLADFRGDFGNDFYSWSETGADVPPVDSIFTDFANGDLSIDTGNVNSWYVNGKGDPRTAIATDFNGDSRSILVTTGTTDIGADEFDTGTTPINATETGTIGSGSTTIYTFANKEILSIDWEAATAYPDSMTVQYWSGDTPPNPFGPSAEYGDGHWLFEPTSGILDAGSYTINVNFGPHEVGTIVGPDLNTIFAKYDAPYWTNYPAGTDTLQSVMDYSTDPKTVTVRELKDFSNGALTSGINPLPIKLLSFEAKAENDWVILEWATASEINNDYFTIERSMNGQDWKSIAEVKGAGNSKTVQTYQDIDKEPYSGVSYYRLKQTDFDGEFEYSRVKGVNIDEFTNTKVQVYPNPTKNKITITGNTVELHRIQVFNMLGQEVTALTKQIRENDGKLVVDLSNLNAGIFLVKTKTTTRRVYKE